MFKEMSDDGDHPEWLRRRLWWVRPDAQGELHQGRCLRDATLDVHETGVKMNMYDYLGMYDINCSCAFCGDRKIMHRAQMEVERVHGAGSYDPWSRRIIKVDAISRRERLASGDATSSTRRVVLEGGVEAAGDDRQQRLSQGDARASVDVAQQERLPVRNVPADNSVEQYDKHSEAGARRNVRLRSPDAPATSSRTPITECYAVRRPLFNDILMRLNVKTPSVDGFADERLHLLDHWLGPGSDVPNALEMDWSTESLLWLNPPFSLLTQVVRMIITDRAAAVLIMPHWADQPFFSEVRPYIVRKHFYPKGTLMFETREGGVGGTKWPVWALLVDGGV